MTRGRAIKIGLAVLGGVLVTGLLAPSFKPDDRYRPAIQHALERALGRKVSFGEVRYNLLTGPGFTVNKLVIEEDPALGAEPVAYVERLDASPHIWTLFTGHLAFSSLRLEDAHLNLSRADVAPGEYRWNFESLLRPELVAAFPHITMRSSRINFKAGNVKSIVYLLNSDLDIRPPSTLGRPWRFEFEGYPARTDRPARESGALRARGSWRPGTIDTDLQLDRSDLEDLLAVIRGEDIGLHGRVSGHARLHGPPSSIAIDGGLQIEDLHGWDQSVPKGEVWPLDLHGKWNAPAQEIELDARILNRKEPVVSVHYLVDRYLTQPRWGVTVAMKQLSIEPLVPLLRHMGAMLPDSFRMTGELDGALGFSASGASSGQAALRHARITTAGLPPLDIAEAQVLAANGQIRLAPATIVTPDQQPDQQQAQLDAAYDFASGRASFHITGYGINVTTLGRQTSLAAIPLLSEISAGQWSGDLSYRQQPGELPSWSGDIQVANAKLFFPGFAGPVTLESAEGHLEGSAVTLRRIRGTAAGIPVQGEYRYDPEASRPHQFRLAVAALTGPVLENFMLPTLRRGSLFGIALRFGRAPVPQWLREMRADGTVEIGALDLPPVQLTHVRSRVLWDSTHMAFPNLTADAGGGKLAARVHADLRNSVPAYEVAARMTGLDWRGGKLDSVAAIETRGTGADTLTNLHANGSFSGVDLPEDWETASGRFDFAWRAPVPRLTLDDLRLVSETDNYTGRGAMQEDGTVLLQLTTGARQLSLAVNLVSSSPLSIGSFK